MEVRHYIAYGLILAILTIAGIAGGVYSRRRSARKRRLRGIKNYDRPARS